VAAWVAAAAAVEGALAAEGALAVEQLVTPLAVLSSVWQAQLYCKNNGGNNLTVSANGNFTFPNSVINGNSYDVTISSQPNGQTCSSTYGAGTSSGANVTSVNIFCGPASVGGFVSTGNLANARQFHSATLLSSGLVLVAGGDPGSNTATTPTAEIYNPSSSTWMSAGSMVTARESHTATLLPNGKVLVAGGFNGNTGGIFIASAELYDPTTNTWSSTGNMATARSSHTATLLPNGNVLVAGGYNGGGILSSSELYNPSTNTWSSVGNLSSARYLHTAVLLPNGNVLVTGGVNSSIIASAELYNPTSNSWTTTGSLATARYLNTSTLLPSGNVLVTGGSTSLVNISSAELYDLASGTWSSAGNMSTARIEHTAMLLPTGKVLIAGGGHSGNSPAVLASAELYDPVSNVWVLTGSLNSARQAHTSTLLSNGKVLLVGGLSASSTALASTELYW
jgi:N-acetylneuraminic acid mutarotase